MEQKENSGAIFANKQKKSENSPDFYTKNKINGVLSLISLWKKKDKNGNTYLSYSIKPVDEEVKPVSVDSNSQFGEIDDSSDFPF